ncbi:uncharacterized protein NKAPD1 isoform X1 [Protopterus annectens]|uniref:uncharacterized protein NKAPD1 isoform X1 n=1 Tax=Protopterus annectens TaxID=7888 RepID=UPI001CFBF81F|nr:uncharacterized protein NKAPD1 isoform X1 [Protopterus annectens]
MSRVPLGKVLLRNVIRHTDAHNKIQEETEMWKMREIEKQSMTESLKRKYREPSPDPSRWGHSGYMELYPEEFETSRVLKREVKNDILSRIKSVPKSKSRMRCDGFDESESRAVRSSSRAVVTMQQNIWEARQSSKKLQKIEASDPERWGHSGYKELYPEEFESESEEQGSNKDSTLNGKKTSRHKKQISQGSRKRKRSKQSHKKKKKRSHKKVKRKKREQSTDSSNEGTSSDERTYERKKTKRKHKKKSTKKLRKSPSFSSDESDWTSESESELSSSDESEAEQSRKSKKKSHQSRTLSETETIEKKNKRKNWKVANDERSESSEED